MDRPKHRPVDSEPNRFAEQGARDPLQARHASVPELQADGALVLARNAPRAGDFASLPDLGRQVDVLRAQRRHREAHELELRAAALFPGDLLAQVVTCETAVAACLEPLARECVQRARLLLSTRTPPQLRQIVQELGVRVTSMARKAQPAKPPRRSEWRAPETVKPRPDAGDTTAPTLVDRAAVAVAAPASPALDVELHFQSLTLALSPPVDLEPSTALIDYRLRLQALEVLRLQSFETLLALADLRGVDRYDYQIRTVTRVLREFYGRALLADEVGLGKTVEACLCLKEYLLRGLVTRVLVLVPPSLRAQWKDELASKFGIDATLIDGDEARLEPGLWSQPGVLVASLGLARLEPHASNIAANSFDLVIVDEAHRLKNRRSRSWQLVDRLRSRFLLLLSATPVENDLVEIYNLLALLKPGLFSTEAEFKRAFLGAEPGGGGSRRRAVKDPVKLRALLREVMIRNTRALAEAKLPPRFAATLRAAPGDAEARLYADVGDAVRRALAEGRLARASAGEILRATGSSPAAAAPLLAARVDPVLAARARALSAPAKDAQLAQLLAQRRGEKVLLFAAHLATLDHLLEVVRASGRSAAFFHGRLTSSEKEAAMAAFADPAGADVLVSSESGGEGFNLQFARTIVNYDLPWNPMRLEQRIGRVHRIGQEREVYVFNLVSAGTVEEEILRVLDEKINMFELVVGEVEAILGRLGDDELEFQELVLDLYAGASDGAELRRRFDELGERMLTARGAYQAVRELEDKAFGRDLEA